MACPCGSQKRYQDCCQPLHLNLEQGSCKAQTPEQLMRSRYSAFVLKNFDYILKTQHPDCVGDLTLASLNAGPHPDWLGLEVLHASQQESLIDGMLHETGTVTFKAWYKQDGELDAIYECSQFIRQDGLWYYTQGQQMATKLPTRNDPCVCHSGKKFKHCCLKT
jgi:SEC-C motif-containing protein